MRVIHASQPPDLRHQVARQDGVEVNRTNKVGPGKQQVKEKPEVVLQVKAFPFPEKTIQPLLPERLLSQWRFGALSSYPHQRYLIPRLSQRCTDAYHPLVEAELIGDGES